MKSGVGRGFLLGLAMGWAVSPFFGAVSYLRRARTFHPRGVTFHATVAAHAKAPAELEPLAARLAGFALVRFSGALWKAHDSLPDVLGCALRFRRDARASADPGGDDQDLLFATIRRPWTMPFAPFATRTRDYFANDYFAVSPFDVGLRRPVYFRLRPAHPSAEPAGGEASRPERLLREVERGQAVLDIEASARPFGPWRPVSVVSLSRVAQVDDEALRFQPFRAGRGVRPVGVVHALRIGVYSVSQTGRRRAHDT